jgi:radical SAM protein with 4Fe4S-binding SPASM domain
VARVADLLRVDPVAGSLVKSQALARIRTDFSRLARGPRVDYPVQVNVEMYSACPATCTFCTYPTLERKGTRMSDALLDKILADLTAIPRHIPFAFCPFLLSEPFADRRLHPTLARLESDVPNAAVCLVTTGTLLDARQLAKLRERRNILELVISLNFCDPQEYERSMGIPWARTWANLTALHQAAVAGDLPFAVHISRVNGEAAADAQFRQFVRRELPAFALRTVDRHGWLGHVEAPVRDFDALACTQWFELKVASTGDVVLCCQDSHGQHVIGNVTTASLLEIYNRPQARAQRENLTARSQFASCQGCGFSRVVGVTDPDYFAPPA